MQSRYALQLLDRHAWWLLTLAYIGFVSVVAPLGTAFQFGGDEGYELMKGLLVSRGYALYHPIWTDQPPLYSVMLGELFRSLGPSLYFARLMAVGFAGLLVASMYQVVRQQSGVLAATVAVLVLIGMASFIELSVSVITEMATMGVGMLSVVAVFRYYGHLRLRWDGKDIRITSGLGEMARLEGPGDEARGRIERNTTLLNWWRRRGGLIVSGMVFGCALQIKFTAAILVPAVVIEIWINARRDGLGRSHHGFGLGIGDVVTWGSATVASFGVLALAFYSRSAWGIFWLSHFSEALRRALAQTGSVYAFNLKSLLTDYGPCLAALLGIILVFRGRRWELSFPIVLLLTALIVHVNHEPYWYYYALHFAIPLAWLAGVGVEIGWTELWVSNPLRHRVPALAWTLPCLWMLIISILTVGWLEGMGRALNGVENVAVVNQVKLETALATNQVQARWVFADRDIFAFHAGLPVPPELAVLSKKRFWTGQINRKEIVFELQKYRPELILLAGWLRQDWTFDGGREEQHVSMPADVVGEYLSRQYDEVFHDHAGSLYVRKDLASRTPRKAKQAVTLQTNDMGQVSFPR